MKSTRIFKYSFLSLILLFVLCRCSFTNVCSNPQDASCTRVLFIGNSYTFTNNLPDMFAELAQAGGHPVEVGMSAPGGWTLADHLQSPETLNAISSKKWTVVILQEQSQIPSIDPGRLQIMYPAGRELVRKIRETGAEPMFFVTWAHRGGWPENGMGTYQSMQAQIDTGYAGIALEQSVPVAPVGSAWFRAVSTHPGLSLWQADGSHPSEQGTYLAACVFYAMVFHESPIGLTYHAGLSEEIARELQAIAAETVPAP